MIKIDPNSKEYREEQDRQLGILEIGFETTAIELAIISSPDAKRRLSLELQELSSEEGEKICARDHSARVRRAALRRVLLVD